MEKFKTTISDLSSNFEEYMRMPGMGQKAVIPQAKGFVIGDRGTRLFWEMDPTPNGCFRLYTFNEDGRCTGARYYWPDTKITIIYP